MHFKTSPDIKQIDSFTTADGAVYGLEKYINKYGRGETRHYLSYNGKITTPMNPGKFNKWKLEEQQKNNTMETIKVYLEWSEILKSYSIVAKADDAPASEAHPESFPRREDAEQIAGQTVRELQEANPGKKVILDLNK